MSAGDRKKKQGAHEIQTGCASGLRPAVAPNERSMEGHLFVISS